MHSVYMNQAAQGGSGPYSAMPVTGTGTAGSWSCVVGAERKGGCFSLCLPPDPSMVNAYMYQPGAGSGQAAPQGPAVPTTTPAYSSYQPTATQGYQARAVACHTVAVAHGWGVLQGWDILQGPLGGRERGLVGPRSLGLPLLSLAVRWGQNQVSASQGCRGRTRGSRGGGRLVLVLGRWFEMCHGCPRRLTSLSSTERGLAVAEHPGHLAGPPGEHHGLHGQPVGLHGLPALRHAGEGTGGELRGHMPVEPLGPAVPVVGKERPGRVWVSPALGHCRPPAPDGRPSAGPPVRAAGAGRGAEQPPRPALPARAAATLPAGECWGLGGSQDWAPGLRSLTDPPHLLQMAPAGGAPQQPQPAPAQPPQGSGEAQLISFD